MELETIKSELRNYIRENYRVSQDDPDFNDNVHLYDYGYVDSFGSVQLKTFLESKFSIQFSQKDLTTIQLNTVEQMAGFVIKRKKGEV
jgi:methoxymalonate biosynthesis acyl carrier protein